MRVNAGDTVWMLTLTALVFFMMPGLALFYVGWWGRRMSMLRMIERSTYNSGVRPSEHDIGENWAQDLGSISLRTSSRMTRRPVRALISSITQHGLWKSTKCSTSLTLFRATAITHITAAMA
jgi:hypothetical protein